MGHWQPALWEMLVVVIVNHYYTSPSIMYDLINWYDLSNLNELTHIIPMKESMVTDVELIDATIKFCSVVAIKYRVKFIYIKEYY